MDLKFFDTVGKKLTKEEFEKVLEAHKDGKLRRFGSTPEEFQFCGHGCIMQVLLNEKDSIVAMNTNRAVAAWFNSFYAPDLASDKLTELASNFGIVEK